MDSGDETETTEMLVQNTTNLVFELPGSSIGNSIIMSNETSLAPVIIEELEESEILNVNMSEFVEAQALKIHEVTNNTEMEVDDDLELDDVHLDLSDIEDHDVLTAEEENLFTQQFLNGELTFSEYSLKMDRSIDLEEPETEIVRIAPENVKTVEPEQSSPQKSGNLSSSRPKRKRRILPPALQGLMGEANLRFARGEVDLAVQMCMEIIRQVPSAPEPFQTLSMIYETDQPEKSLQFSLIAAHLSPKDADQWLRLANLSLEADDIKQAITCYSKAIQASPTDITLYEERAKLQERNGDKRACLKGYLKLINQLGPEDGEHIVNYAKILAQKFMQEDNNDQALEAMDHIFIKCPEMVTLEEVNIMTELLIALKHFHRCLDILTSYTSINIEYKSLETGKDREVEICEIPDEIVVDLKAKCLITLIELNHTEIADKHLKKLLKIEDPEISGDLYLDIAEALMNKKEFEKALALIEPLVKSENYSLAAVWLRHAECWIGCRDIKKSIESYEIVRKLSPQHLGARIELAKLYKLTGHYDRAIDVLDQDPEVDVLDTGVIYRRTLLLLKVERYDEFFEAGKLLLSRHCINLRSKTELTTLTRSNLLRQRRDALQLYRLSLGETLEEENSPTFSKDNEPTVKKEFSLFLRMCRVAFRLKRFGLLQRICFSALTSKRFEKKNSHLIFLCIVACIHNIDSFHGYNLVRDLVRVCRRSNTWNLLNIVIQRAEDTRHNRFIMRLLGREDAFSYLQILHANNCLVSGTYKYALNDYVSLFKAEPSGLLALLIAVTFIQMACQKFASKKHQLVTQALAFFNKYVQLRGSEAKQERNYNMARAFHQLGLLSGAVHHYKLVLESPPPKLVSQHPDELDLKREAAFNLHLIYLQSGNPDLARTYLEDYIVVKMSQSLASQIQFSKLCEVYEKISKVRGNKKIEELRKFFDFCRRTGKDLKTLNKDADVSLFPVMRLFLPGADRERGPHGLKEKALAALFVRVLCLGKNSLDGKKLMNYKAPEQGESGMGDFAEKLYWVLKGRHSNTPCTLSVENVNVILDEIARRNANNQSKDEEFFRLVKHMGPSELKWLTRTILKDVKLGMGQKKIFEAYHPDADDLFGEKSNLREICDVLLDPSHRVKKNSSNIVVLSPFKPMLLERCSIEEIGKFFINNESYFVQTKYDGERSQIHMKDGKFKYYTRHGTDITNNWAYGESRESGGFLTTKISSLFNENCRSIILDGELMGWHKDRKILGSKGMPFDVKKLTANSRHRPCFVAFDIVMYNDRLLVNVPYKDRLPLLNTAFQESEGVLLKSAITSISTCAELLDVFNKSLDAKDEGIVLKRSDGLYKPNTREGSGCYKIKAEYSEALIQDLDLLILGAYYGEGKYAGMFSTFLVGVAENENNSTKKFYSVVSVSTGLSIEKMKELDRKFKPHWTKECPENVIGPKKNPPDVWIHPENSLILQLRATELTRCSIHPAGYTLRFPRVVKIRDDKPWEDAWTLRELRAMVKDGGFVQKATKRHASSADVRESTVLKMPRSTRSAPSKIDAKYFGIQAAQVPRITRIFQGKEFCVLNGEESLAKNDKLSKPDIERILISHGAKVVQNPGNNTFAIIVGNPITERVKNLMKIRKWDVVHLNWLRRVTEKKNWHRVDDWFPWEIISCTDSTENHLANAFDEFDDSYTIDADEESLKRSLEIANEALGENIDLPFDQHEELDSELFENGISPFSLFRKLVGYFDDPTDSKIHEFTFMRGTIKETIDPSVTHVFVNERAICLIDLYKKINVSGTAEIKILNSSWIRNSFKQQNLLPDDDYIIA